MSGIHDSHHENSGEYGSLLGLAFDAIKKQAAKRHLLLDHLGEPVVRSEPGCYKVEWQDEESGDMVTLYHDGVWAFDGEKGPCIEGKIAPLHYKVWANRLVKAERVMVPGLAIFAIGYFKQLLEKK